MQNKIALKNERLYSFAIMMTTTVSYSFGPVPHLVRFDYKTPGADPKKNFLIGHPGLFFIHFRPFQTICRIKM